MSAFLLLLAKVNLAMAAAIVLASLLRRSLRLWFGAPIAYAVWFLVPMAGLACLLPPRVAAPVAPAHLAASLSVMEPIAHSVPRVATGQSALVLAGAPAFAMPDPARMLFMAWALGALLMTLYLIRLQLRFSAAMREGRAGPAVLGFIRPRIVMPDGFEDHFTRQEQAAILAHEQIHLARQDARVNALTALLRCLCWFNPLIHWGARLLRVDQELACDATAVAGDISRRTYAQALLKSQMVVASLPLGCNWPGAQHPLIERIALLRRKPPGAARRVAGIGLVMLAAGFAGLGAWAAQPPVTKTARPPMMVLVAPPPMVAAPDRIGQKPATANPAGSDADAPRDVSAAKAVSPEPLRENARTVRIGTGVQSVLAALPKIAPIFEPELADQARADPDLAATASGMAAAPAPVVMANTPSGEGDPDTIVCRAPQRIADTNQSGEEACGHNYEWKKLALNGKDLAPDGRTLIPRATVAGDAATPTDPLSAAASGHQTATEPALACLLGFMPWRCAYRLWGGDTWPITDCAKQYVHRWLDNCADGPLESVEYLGTNPAGADVYDVRFMHSEVIYILAPPGMDGKLGWFKIRRGNPRAIIPSSLVDVSASTTGKRLLYRRPWG